jgi:hypothetical protein
MKDSQIATVQLVLIWNPSHLLHLHLQLLLQLLQLLLQLLQLLLRIKKELLSPEPQFPFVTFQRQLAF